MIASYSGSGECQSSLVRWDIIFLLSPTRAAFLVPPQLSTAKLPSKKEKARKGDLACVFRVILPTFDSGYAPLPTTLELFNLEGQRRTGKVH